MTYAESVSEATNTNGIRINNKATSTTNEKRDTPDSRLCVRVLILEINQFFFPSFCWSCCSSSREDQNIIVLAKYNKKPEQ